MVLNAQRKLEEMTLEDFQGYPRASSWIARHSDIKRITDYMKLAPKPRVLDSGCGNGFNSILLAMEGLDILGVNIGEDFIEYDSKLKLMLKTGNAEDKKWYRGRNIMFNSWMPACTDWSGCFKYNKPTPCMIIYVKSRSTGLQPGMANNPNNWNTYSLPSGFVEADRWFCFGNDDFETENIPKLTSKSGEVIVQVNKELYAVKSKAFQDIEKSKTIAKLYNWEKDLPV